MNRFLTREWCTGSRYFLCEGWMGRKIWLRGCSKNLGSRQQRPQDSIRVGSAVVNEVKSTGLRNQLGVENESRSVMFASSQCYGLWPTRLLCPWDSPVKMENLPTAVGSHSLLQRIFPTQGSNPGFQHHRQITYHLNTDPFPIYTSGNNMFSSLLYPTACLSPPTGYLRQRSPTFLALEISFLEDSFSMELGGWSMGWFKCSYENLMPPLILQEAELRR